MPDNELDTKKFLFYTEIFSFSSKEISEKAEKLWHEFLWKTDNIKEENNSVVIRDNQQTWNHY